MKKILITGSDGLIGKKICEHFSENEIIRFDLKRGLDILCTNDLDEASDSSEIGTILHLAAMSRVGICENDPLKAVRTNVLGTANVIRLARATGARLIFTSSREVYGNAGYVSEDAVYEPRNTYAYTKVDGEKLVNRAIDDGVQAQIFRLSSVAGDLNDHPDRLIPAFAKVAAKGGELKIIGSKKTFDFTDVIDVAAFIAKFAKQPVWNDVGPVHLTSGRGVTIESIAMAARIMAAERGRTVFTTNVEGSELEVERFVGRTFKAFDLGWRCDYYAFENMFARLVKEFERT